MTVIPHPLSPWLYFRRNPGRTLPVVAVIAVSVMLIAAVVSLLSSVDLTVLTMYGYQRRLCVVTPRNALAVDPAIRKRIDADPLTDRVFTVRPAITQAKTIFGKLPYVICGVSKEAAADVMRRLELRLAAGRMPAEGKPEAVLHVDIARNRGLRIGDVVLDPDTADSYSAVPTRVVGLLDGPVWMALTSETFVREYFPVNPEGLLVLARDEPTQRRLDASLHKALPGKEARVWSYSTLVEETRDALSSMYLITNLVIGIIVLAIAFLTGTLANIHYTQRLPEFATLAAIGYQRSRLVWRVLAEMALLCVLGWVLGTVLNLALLLAVDRWVMTPRGLLLNPLDARAYRYTLPLPITIAVFGALPIARRLRALDPVGIIERRQ